MIQEKIQSKENVVTFNHRGKEFSTRERNVILKSSTFSYLYNFHLHSYISINSNFSTSAVREFHHFFDTGIIDVKDNNVVEILSLADTWQCALLQSECVKIINGQLPDDTIAQFLKVLENSLETFTIEKIIMANIQIYMQSPFFLKFPINLILKFLTASKPTPPASEIVNLATKLIHSRGSIGLEILPFISFAEANNESISNLVGEMKFLDQIHTTQIINHIYELRLKNEKDNFRMWRLLYQAVATNNEHPKIMVAKMLHDGTYLDRDFQESTNILSQLTKSKNPEAQFYCSQMVGCSDDKESLKLLILSADQNYEPAILKLSEKLIRDRSILKPQKMFNYIEKAALLGSAKAEFALGTFYRDGFGVKQNFDIAMEYFGNAAVHNNSNGLNEYLKLKKSQDNRLFFRLIEAGNIDFINTYISYDSSSVRCQNVENWTVAHYAAIPKNGFDVLSFFVQNYSVDVNTSTLTGTRPIHIACLNGNLNAVQFLIQKCNCTVNILTFKKEHPIHFACRSGNISLVHFLTRECKSDITLTTSDRWNCLHYACESGSNEVVKYLLHQNIDVNSLTNERESPLHLACKSGNFDLVNQMLKIPNIKPSILTVQKASIFHYACMSGNLEIIQLLEATDQSWLSGVTVMRETALHFACLSGSVKAVEYMIKKANFNPNVITFLNESILHFACKSGNEKLVIFLLKICDFDVTLQNIVLFIFYLMNY